MTYFKCILNKKSFGTKFHEGYLACVSDDRFAKQSHIIDALGSIEEVQTKVLTTLKL